MRKFISSLNSVFLALALLAGSLIYSQPSTNAVPVDPWWNPDISADEAADLYCESIGFEVGDAATGESAIIPREGLVLTDDQWTNVTLRGVGCDGLTRHQVTLYGQELINGVPLIDFSQSGYENVTSRTDVNAFGGARLIGDELWMFDTGIGDADHHNGSDTTLRINRSFFPDSGPYNIEINGMGWFVPSGCPNPISYSDLGSSSGCAWENVLRTNQEASQFSVLVEANPPTGVIDTTPLGQVGVVGQACSAVSGWTLDEDSPSSALIVKVYLQTGPNDDPVLTEVYSTTADGARSDQYTGHGFTIPAEVLNQHVSLDNPNATFVIKAVGIVQNGDPIGDPDGIFLGSTQVSVCVAPDEDPDIIAPPATGRVAIAALISVVLIGGIAAGSMALIKRSHKKVSTK